jgi:hypothetical protein
MLFNSLKLRLLCVAVAVAASCPLFAQRDAASLEGRVVDSSGAVVAGAQVTATNTATNFKYQAQSDTSGAWVISPVRIGSYKVSIAAQGFKEAVAGPITLDVQQRQRVDVTLELGDVHEHVEVRDTAPLLETGSSETGQVVDGESMVAFPLNGRNPVQLAQLTVGVTTSEPGARDSGGYGFSANGARSLDNNFLLDGIDNNSNLPDLLNEANYVVMPPPDALEEFKIETGNYDAEFGRATGAIVNATTKSGSNQFHGVLYEFLRNQAFDALNYFDSAQQPYHQNQFGATLGGRIIRDKLLFFVDYQGLRLSQAQTTTSVVPTDAERSGDFSSQLDLTSPTGVLDCNGVATYAGEIFDTRQTQPSGDGFCGVPFGYLDGAPINVIPSSGKDSLGKKLINLFPEPNVNASGYNYISDPVTTQTVNQGDVRIDQVVTKSDNAFYRFSESSSPETIGSPFTGIADGGGFFDGIQQITAYAGAASEVHIFSPHKINEFRAGFNWIKTSRYQANSNTDISSQVGFPGVPYLAGTNNGGLPQLVFADASNLGSPTFLPAIEKQKTLQFSDTFTLIAGNNTWKFGGEIRPEHFSIYEPADPRGTMSFTHQFTDNAGAIGTGGNSLAALLTGQPEGGTINNLNNIEYHRNTFALFLQDDWRILPKLTLNLGMRYEFFSPVYSAHDAQANFNPITGNLDIPKDSNVSLTPTLAAILPVNHTASGALIGADHTDFSPRVGLSYSPTKRVVIHSAFGIFYNGDEAGPYSNPSPGFNPPYFISETYAAGCSLPYYSTDPNKSCEAQGISTLANGFPSNALIDPNTPVLFSLDTKLKMPYVIQWHLATQYQFTSKTMLELAYIGSKSDRSYIYLNLNQAQPTADSSAPTAPRRPFPYVDASIGYLKSAGSANYNGLQASLQQRMSAGLEFIVNYTYSKALGNASSADLGSQNNDGFRNSLYPNKEYGPLDFDIRNRFVASYVYDLPFGAGKRFATHIRPIDEAIGHWNWSGIVTLSNGTWFTVTDGNANFANSDGQQRPDVVSGVKATSKPCVAGTFFNTCAFQDPQPGSSGNVGLNTLEGPGNKNVDFAILKTIPLGEARRIEFRAEAFNIFNHPNFQFAAPGPQNSINSTVMGTATFGYLTGALAPRQLQLALKLFY